MCNEVVGVSAFGFINRGFATVVRPAMGGSLLDTDCVSCGLCIGTCPTGAIEMRLPLAKPGPWETTSVPTVCHYCGVGCEINYEAYGDSLIKVSRREDNPVTFGAHCRKGLFGFEYIQAGDRLLRAMVRPGRELQETALEDAISYAAMRLKELLRRHSPEEIAVFVSPRLTNEEVYLTQKLARVALRTHNVTSFARLANRELDCPEVISTATYSDLVDAQAILVVNSNLDEEHFVADLLVKRAIRKGARLVYIGSAANRTSHPAEIFLQCKPGTETLVVLAIAAEYAATTGRDLSDHETLATAARSLTPKAFEKRTGVAWAAVTAAATVFTQSILKVVVFNKDFRGPRTPGDERLFARAASLMGAPHLALREKSNMQGLLDMGASPTWLPGYIALDDDVAIDALEKEWCVVLRDMNGHDGDLAAALAEKKIKVALVVGEDPLGAEDLPQELRDGLASVEFLLVADVAFTATARAANVVIPLSSTAETNGTMTNSERRVQKVRQAIPPRNGLETWQILTRLGDRLGHRFKMKYGGVDEVTEEIRRVVHAYRGVVIDDAGSDGIWDAGLFPLAAPSADAQSLGAVVRPTATLALDCVEARLAARLRTLIDDARARREGLAVAASS
jgi:formate dehydrogenase major subunit